MQRLTVRLPKSQVDKLSQAARNLERTISDVVRAHLSADPMLQLERVPGARKRPPSVIPADPALIRQLASIGSNINQLARAVNALLLAERPSAAIVHLAQLRSIEQHLADLKQLELQRCGRAGEC